MRKSLVAVAAASLILAPAAASAQGFAVAGRAGTLGLGAEAALGLSPNFAIRGGLGLMPLEPTATIDDIEFTVGLPETWYNIGADLYLGRSGFRIGGGMLFKPDDPTLVGELTANASIEIGDETYTSQDLFALRGTIDSKDSAPYLLFGFGRHVTQGIGLFADIGAAYFGEPANVILEADVNTNRVSQEEVDRELRKQEQRTKDDLGSYLKLWPILNIGLKIGLGGS